MQMLWARPVCSASGPGTSTDHSALLEWTVLVRGTGMSSDITACSALRPAQSCQTQLLPSWCFAALCCPVKARSTCAFFDRLSLHCRICSWRDIGALLRGPSLVEKLQQLAGKSCMLGIEDSYGEARWPCNALSQTSLIPGADENRRKTNITSIAIHTKQQGKNYKQV